ncbi:GrpB family protein [Flavobacterium sp. NKUCC04_CG]|uniref:GrpB family protein n=1 Tax=Flavobacterium sp. NKUCC04_CG TaxID=2842121 RepID=UPI001C5B7008|nr:GrpB family protein [Flavobacterium sp. NKUCC04_CG]MBW3519972.1 GrpB family protein [Flavobacterium sp. NKUCC04_CG]
MILPFEKYTVDWKKQFETIEIELLDALSELAVSVEHIGSTAVVGLSAKPVIDVLVGVAVESDLDKVAGLLSAGNYVYYEKYNVLMPYRRFFLLLNQSPEQLGIPKRFTQSDEIPETVHDHQYRRAHIHVIPINSEHWLRHIAFRDYLSAHQQVKAQYQTLKEHLVEREWKDGNDYNTYKDAFLKEHEQKAVTWYRKLHNL